MEKEQIQARLSIKDIHGMDKRQFKAFLKWLKRVYVELEAEDRAIWAKNPRFTLFK